MIQKTDGELFQEAFALEAKGKHSQARRIYQTILAAIPNHPGALYKLGEHAKLAGQFETAKDYLQNAAQSARAKGIDATSIYALLGDVQMQLQNYSMALTAYQHCPNEVNALINGLICHARMGNGLAAESAGELAISKIPQLVEAWRFYAGYLFEQKKYPNCSHVLTKALHIHPKDESIILLAAQSARAQGHSQQALKLLQAGDETADLLSFQGSLLVDTQQHQIAIAILKRAIALGAQTAHNYDHLGQAYLRVHDASALSEAVKAFQQAVALDPGLTPAWANLINSQRESLDWQGAEVNWHLYPKDNDDKRFAPFIALNLPISAMLCRDITRQWPHPKIEAWPAVTWSHSRIKIAYLSNDLHEHATLRLMIGLLELHTYEVHVYSHGPITHDALQERAQHAVAHWHDVRQWSDEAIAQHIRAAEIDILVDLKGHTFGARLNVMAYCPAPLQVHYLGYPGTLAAPGIDYFIADNITVPPEHETHFTEHLLRLPRCYQVNDHTRVLPSVNARASTRSELKVGDADILLASFNQAYKLDESLVTIWLECLCLAPNIKLWLLLSNAIAQEKIMSLASSKGIASQIIFADKVSNLAHIDRLSAADLVLDSFQIGAHTSASDALWAGVPVLTVLGDRFSARVAASALTAVYLDQFICKDPTHYQQQLTTLCQNPALLQDAQSHLRQRRQALPLFDTKGFVEDYESLLNIRLNELRQSRQ